MDDDTSHQITITKRCSAPRGINTQLRAAVHRTLKVHSVVRSQVDITLVDDAEMAELNLRHLKHPGPTDVLTFDLSENLSRQLEGEIVVSVDTATRESAKRLHSPSDELTLYVVHGMLHLLGHDDKTPRKAMRMHEKEDEILTELGLGPVYSGAQKTERPRRKAATSARPQARTKRSSATSVKTRSKI